MSVFKKQTITGLFDSSGVLQGYIGQDGKERLGGMSLRQSCLLQPPGNWSIPGDGSTNSLAFTQVVYDPFNLSNAGSPRCPAGMLWCRAIASLGFSANATGMRGLVILKNGSTGPGQGENNKPAPIDGYPWQGQTGGAWFPVVKNDVISVLVTNDSGVALGTGGIDGDWLFVEFTNSLNP